MELLCPECRALLEVSGRKAVCRTHGGDYELLFDREAESMRRTPAAQAAPPDTFCANHANVGADYVCPSCAKPVCSVCSLEMYGTQYCSDCAAQRASEGPPAIPDPPRRPAVPPGTMCAQHPAVDAVAQCRVCRNAVCATCDFALPGGLHVCPQCIETHSDQDVNPKRIRRAWLAIVLAAFTTLLFVVVFSGALVRMFELDPNSELTATLIGNLLLWPALAGIVVALLSFDRRLRNPPVIWTAVIWNAAMVGLFMLLVVVGLVIG
jgi:hypothetical protein